MTEEIPLPALGGAPKDVYASRDYVIVHMGAVRALGSWEAAGCFQRIAWRCERDGYWRASMAQIAEEIGVSERTAKRITKTLRDAGWVASDRSAAYDATLTWRIVWAITSESANLALSEGPEQAAERAKLSPSEKAKLALSSTETIETKDETLFVVADAPPEPEPTEPGALFDVAAPLSIEDQFEEFYREFPRKIGKGQAAKAYKAARKKASAEQILAGLMKHLPSLLGRERQYIPHPTTWLNGERWADDIEGVPQRPNQPHRPNDPAYRASIANDF